MESIRAKLDALLSSDRYATAARAFKAKYADFDPAAQVDRMVGRVEELRTRARRMFGRGRAADAVPARARHSVPAGVFRA